jgi:hypothetical protein
MFVELDLYSALRAKINFDCKFNVFHARALYYTKTLITNKCTKSFTINRNTLLHVSPMLDSLQGELFVILTLRLHFIVEWEGAVDCVLRCFWRRELSVVRACAAVQAGTAKISPLQYTVHSQQHIVTQL